MFSVGLDDGSIYIFQHKTQSIFNTFSDYAKLKPHSARVMGLCVVYNTGSCYSCGSDKVFTVTDISNPQKRNEFIYKSNFGFTNLYHDIDNKRIFLTDEGGQIFVFVIAATPPLQVMRMRTISSGCIRGLYVDLKKELLFTANTLGTISIVEMGMPGKESMMKEISNFGFKAKLRLISYDSELNNLITGDQQGNITIWSLRTGKSICT